MWHKNGNFLLVIFVLLGSVHVGTSFTTDICRISSFRQKSLAIFSSESSDEVSRLRETAEKLRREAQDLEDELLDTPSSLMRRDTIAADGALSTTPKRAVYTDMKDSVWTMTYRFASDPPPKETDEDPDRPVSNYSGKLKLKFRSDGYTDLLSHEPTGENRLQFAKVWGWDQEVSSEDDKTYVLFSTNVELPSTDLTLPNESLRCYWQAMLESSGSSAGLSLTEGTVTVKKDIEPPGGFWGIFNAGGILAQFRYVGNFVSRADLV